MRTREEIEKRIREAVEAERTHPPLTKIPPNKEEMGDAISGTARALLEKAVEKFKQLPPEQQKQQRQRILEGLAFPKPPAPPR